MDRWVSTSMLLLTGVWTGGSILAKFVLVYIYFLFTKPLINNIVVFMEINAGVSVTVTIHQTIYASQ